MECKLFSTDINSSYSHYYIFNPKMCTELVCRPQGDFSR
jgi:hypothetical protein